MLASLYHDWFNHSEYWFSNSFDSYLSNTYFYLIDSSFYLNTKEDYIGFIILYDQISRHYYRGTFSHHILSYYSFRASLISRRILHRFSFNENELLFIYLPFRHLFDFVMIDKIISIYIQKYLQESLQFYKKIIYATISRSIYMRNRFFIQHQDYNYNLLYQSVLEYNPIKPMKKTCNELFINYNDNLPLIVSLSGGVDSNVLLYLCSFLKVPIIAIHINYNNRKTCDMEEDFLKHYCSMLNIPLYIRKISELNRNICHKNGLRDLYEDLTKQIRYDMYKQLVQIYGSSYICLGHNLDDCFENIITNISKNQKYDNLHGMNVFSIIDDIHFYRPFLSIPKSQIIQFAHQHFIPYLEDSTPKWSARGRIRDFIKPCLEEFHLTKSLFDLSNHLTSITNVIQQIIVPLLDEIGIVPLDEYVWKEYFHKKGIKVSNKCMKEFLLFLQKSPKNNKFVLNRNYKFKIIH
jgi:tRNA(Ile)-lysidine synthetase-like protein